MHHYFALLIDLTLVAILAAILFQGEVSQGEDHENQQAWEVFDLQLSSATTDGTLIALAGLHFLSAVLDLLLAVYAGIAHSSGPDVTIDSKDNSDWDHEIRRIQKTTRHDGI